MKTYNDRDKPKNPNMQLLIFFIKIPNEELPDSGK